MAKAVILLDEIPENCAVCKGQRNGYCMGTKVKMGMGLEVSGQVITKGKPDWCPILQISDYLTEQWASD